MVKSVMQESEELQRK